MPFADTQRSFVNTWECDENAHLNVQFYVARFSDAAAHLFAQVGVETAGSAPRLLSRHVRYHRELHVGDMTLVRSAPAEIEGLDASRFAIVHLLQEPSRDVLAATAIDIYQGAVDRLGPTVAPPDEAVPRGLPPGPSVEKRTASELLAAGYRPTDQVVVRPFQCDADGSMSPSAFIGRYSDGQGFAYEQAGIGRDLLDDAGRGRVTVELKLSLLAPVAAGTPIITYGATVAVARSTFVFRHVTTDAVTGRAVAVGEITAIIMDLTARKTWRLPENLRARLEGKVVDIGLWQPHRR